MWRCVIIEFKFEDEFELLVCWFVGLFIWGGVYLVLFVLLFLCVFF